MKSVLSKDLEILTYVKENYFNKLTELSEWCICDSVEKSILNDDSTSVIDIGFGTLYIQVYNDNIKYRFVPSPSLEENLIRVVSEEINPLKVTAEKTLVSKLTNIYKELI